MKQGNRQNVPVQAGTLQMDTKGSRQDMLELNHIRKAFDGTSVLKDISIKVEDGEIVSILGPSGCGKTTLLNLILGIIPADSGSILYNGEDLTRTPMEKRGFNIVFQDYALFPNLNVRQNITYGLKNRPGISTQEEVRELIALLELDEHLDKRVDQLSGGQKQRVALARTMVMKPRLLLLDEPLSALDGVIKESIKDRIKTIAREYHLTTIIVTHDPEEALTLSDKVLIIHQGSIAQYGRPADIIQTPEDDFVRKFILNQLEIKRNNIYALFGGLTVLISRFYALAFVKLNSPGFCTAQLLAPHSLLPHRHILCTVFKCLILLNVIPSDVPFPVNGHEGL